MKSPFPYYGLVCGERITVVDRPISEFGKRIKVPHFQEVQPDEITVVREYPFFILIRAYFNGFHPHSYDICVNKASIRTGEVEVKRLSTGEYLR